MIIPSYQSPNAMSAAKKGSFKQQMLFSKMERVSFSHYHHCFFYPTWGCDSDSDRLHRKQRPLFNHTSQTKYTQGGLNIGTACHSQIKQTI